ncbi:unknown [Clostridium sp. CAG:352]|nr:unknown [Clostridium sp. CAG:352]
MVNPDGYYLGDFQNTGDSKTGTLRLNQKQLYGKDIAEIAGDYSGTIVFTSSII